MNLIKAAPRGWAESLRFLGPGLIVIGAIVGSGELIATTLLGAQVGFLLLWLVTDTGWRREAARRANHDSLTDLPNRRLLLERLRQAVKLAERHKGAPALILFDLDHFKGINDTWGHRAGDRLLQAVAKRLRNCLRASDTVARLGGDEFMVLLPEVSQPADACQIAQKVLRALRSPFRIEKHGIFGSASVGISLYPNDRRERTGE